ncbi:MAG TPA: hypothetical protein VJH33_04040 [Candidatus Paceibacterota bacterium]
MFEGIFAQNAAQGAALMDRKNPGWFNHIDTGKLSIATTDNCILGQLFGEYSDGCKKLNIDGEERQMDRIRYGFNPSLLAYALFGARYLNRAWKKEIDHRLQNAATA